MLCLGENKRYVMLLCYVMLCYMVDLALHSPQMGRVVAMGMIGVNAVFSGDSGSDKLITW